MFAHAVRILWLFRAAAAVYILAIYFCHYNSAGDRQFCVKGIFQDKGSQRVRTPKEIVSFCSGTGAGTHSSTCTHPHSSACWRVLRRAEFDFIVCARGWCALIEPAAWRTQAQRQQIHQRTGEIGKNMREAKCFSRTSDNSMLEHWAACCRYWTIKLTAELPVLIFLFSASPCFSLYSFAVFYTLQKFYLSKLELHTYIFYYYYWGILL